MKNHHTYTLRLDWNGNPDKDSMKNDRLYEVAIEGKAPFCGSADKPFFGDPTLYNPEDLLLSALSACHMMSFLYLCRKKGIRVLSYQDNPEGFLKVNPDGSGQFEKVVLKPEVQLADIAQREEAIALHPEAGKLCFIANSCNFEIVYEAL